MAYEKEEARRLVVEAGHRLVAAGLIARTWGNISARISDTQFVITPSGMAYDRLRPEDIVVVNISDCSYEGSVKPSSEKGIHADCYALRPDVDFVIHTHQLYGTAYGVLGRPLRVRDALLGEFVPNAEYGISSTKPLRKNVAAELAKYPRAAAVFMRSHGVLALGKSSDSCFDTALRLEELCRAKVEDTLVLPSPAEEPVSISEALRNNVAEDVLLFVDTPAILAASADRGRHYPVIDDMAQIAGVDYGCVALKNGWEKRASAALKGRNIVFLRNRGAICTGRNAEEAQAVATVAEKNCLSALYAAECGVKCRIGAADALLQRSIYTLKYSKLK